MSKKDLIPTSLRSKDEAKEIGRKGGIASGVSRRKAKAGKELVRYLLGLRERDEAFIAQLKEAGLDESEITNEATMHLMQVKEAKTGDTAAYNAVMKSAGYDEQKILLDDPHRLINVGSEKEKEEIDALRNSGL